MNGERPRPESDPHRLAANRLRDALDSPIYEQLAKPTAPLLLSELSAEQRRDPAFLQIVCAVGWPDNLNDRAMRPRHEYTDQAFAEGLIISTAKERLLDNFIYRLSYDQAALNPQTDLADNWRSMDLQTSMYATEPVLYRTIKVAPDLMKGLRDFLAAHPQGENEPPTQRIRRILAGPDNDTFVGAAHLAYKLMGRLVKTTDRQMHRRLLGAPAGNDLVRDVHDYLIG